MFIALDKITNQGLKQAIIIEKVIGAVSMMNFEQIRFLGRLGGATEMELYAPGEDGGKAIRSNPLGSDDRYLYVPTPPSGLRLINSGLRPLTTG